MRGYPPVVRALQLFGCYAIMRAFGVSGALGPLWLIFSICWWFMVEILWDLRQNW